MLAHPDKAKQQRRGQQEKRRDCEITGHTAFSISSWPGGRLPPGYIGYCLTLSLSRLRNRTDAGCCLPPTEITRVTFSSVTSPCELSCQGATVSVALPP